MRIPGINLCKKFAGFIHPLLKKIARPFLTNVQESYTGQISKFKLSGWVVIAKFNFRLSPRERDQINKELDRWTPGTHLVLPPGVVVEALSPQEAKPLWEEFNKEFRDRFNDTSWFV